MFEYKVAEVHIYRTCTKIKPKSYTADSSYYLQVQHILEKLKKIFGGFQTIPYSKTWQ